MTVKFEAKLSADVPKAVTVYELAPVRVSAAMLTSTAQSLGLTGAGGDVISGQDSMALSEGRHYLEIQRKSGAIVFFHRDKYGALPEKPFEMSDKRAEGIARAFIEKTGLVPLASATFRRVTHMQSAVADIKRREVQNQVMDAGVVYTRLIDGIPVEGPGGITMVSIDPAGEVVGLRSTWRPLGAKLEKVKIQPPRAAMEAMEKFGSELQGEVTVTKAGFGYFEQGPMDAQKVIEPVYAFVYVQRYEEVARKSAFVMAAGVKAFAKLSGGKRFPVELQRPRRK